MPEAKTTTTEPPPVTFNLQLMEAVRTAVADYIRSEGCGCCRNEEKHKDAERRLAGLLGVPMYEDASGYDFYQFSTDGPIEEPEGL